MQLEDKSGRKRFKFKEVLAREELHVIQAAWGSLLALRVIESVKCSEQLCRTL